MVHGKIQRATELLEAQVQDELVALDPRAGKCFGFNSVAADIWRLLEQPRTFDELKDELLEQYDVGADECSADLRAVIAAMETAGLVTS